MTIHDILLKKYVVPLLLAVMLSATHAAADELKDISKMVEQGQQEAALKRINTYLEANPKDAQGMFMKGIIQAESGKRSEAIATFNELTKKYPNLPEPYNNLAVLHAEAGQYDLAKKALETAIKIHPSYATAHENLGDIYARMASEAYDKALKLDNGNSRAESKLALIKDLFGPNKPTSLK
jgi:Flp pilus assembly protein TadD